MTISSIRILNANRTRRAFLERIVDPLLSANREEPYTLEETLQQVGGAVDKLNRFGEQARELLFGTGLITTRHLQVPNISLLRQA